MKPVRVHRRSARGFTLVEAVASITILALIAGLASRIIEATSRSWLDGAVAAELERETSHALDRIVIALRDIERDPDEPLVSLRIDAIEPSAVHWHGDQGITLDGDTIVLQDGDIFTPLARNIQTLHFEAYGPDAQRLPDQVDIADAGSIRRITVRIVAVRGDLQFTLRTGIFLRSAIEPGGAP